MDEEGIILSTDKYAIYGQHGPTGHAFGAGYLAKIQTDLAACEYVQSVLYPDHPLVGHEDLTDAPRAASVANCPVPPDDHLMEVQRDAWEEPAADFSALIHS